MAEGTPLTVELEGFAEAMRKLDKATFERVCQGALEKFANEIKLLAIPYPPEGPWNKPGPYPAKWYQRHFGSRWARKSGSTGGADTSERMQKQWIAEQRNPFEAVVGNRASYSSYVVGEEQTDVHARHGWKKLSDVGKMNQDKLLRFIAEEIEKAMGG